MFLFQSILNECNVFFTILSIRTTSIYDILTLVCYIERSGIERDSYDLYIKSDRYCIINNSLSLWYSEYICYKKGYCCPDSEMLFSYKFLEQ